VEVPRQFTLSQNCKIKITKPLTIFVTRSLLAAAARLGVPDRMPHPAKPPTALS
jgi:hypothetical protein